MEEIYLLYTGKYCPLPLLFSPLSSVGELYTQWKIFLKFLDQNKTMFGWIWIKRDGVKGPNQSCLFIYSMVVSTCLIALLFNSRQELFPEGLPEGNSFCQGLKSYSTNNHGINALHVLHWCYTLNNCFIIILLTFNDILL